MPAVQPFFRTDRNNNPIAFTTDIARQAGLLLGKDYEVGESFTTGATKFYTARLLGDDPIAICIKVINTIGFYTKLGALRWAYIGIPYLVWEALSYQNKARVIQFMYDREGGTAMNSLFDKYKLVPSDVKL